MAQYEITYYCGHSGRVNLIGKMSMREWKISKLESDYCPECKEKKRKEQIERENAAVKEKAKEMELPKNEQKE